MAEENFEFLTENDFYDIFKEAGNILSKDYSIMDPIEKIEYMCNFFKNELNSISVDTEKVYILGMKIIFSLRSFLFQESIIFSIGATSPDGNKLSVKEISQEELFKNITANLKSKQIELSSQLEKFDNNLVNQNLSELWKNVVLAADFNWDQGYDEKKIYITSKNKRRYVYSKPGADTNVWVRYYMRQKRRYLTYYYNQGNFNLISYNQGWLYEWFQEYVSDIENQKQLAAAFSKGDIKPLSGMMSEKVRENVPGYKGGDYLRQENGVYQQIQAKMGNRRIITFKSIETVINEILIIINEYKKEIKSGEAGNKIGNEFFKLFTDKQTINEGYDKIADEILTRLKVAY